VCIFPENRQITHNPRKNQCNPKQKNRKNSKELFKRELEELVKPEHALVTADDDERAPRARPTAETSGGMHAQTAHKPRANHPANRKSKTRPEGQAGEAIDGGEENPRAGKKRQKQDIQCA
jgi:hypothetical protein